MAPHAPFNHTYSHPYSPVPLHPRSFEPSLPTKGALLKVDFGPTPTSTMEPTLDPSLHVPYIGIGPVELTATPDLARATDAPSVHASLHPAAHHATQHHHQAAIIAIATISILWFIGISTLCYFQLCRRKKPASNDRESDPGPGEAKINFVRERTRSKNASVPTGADNLKVADWTEKSANSSDFSVETLNGTQSHPQAEGCLSLPLSIGGPAPPSPTLSLGIQTVSEDSSAPATPNCQQIEFYDVPLRSDSTPSPSAGDSRFTWDFKCSGISFQDAKDQALNANGISKIPSLPSLTFSNPLSELMSLIVGPTSLPLRQAPSPVPVSIEGPVGPNNLAQASISSKAGSISASSTWTAISVAESESLHTEELIEHASGQPISVGPNTHTLSSQRVEDDDTTESDKIMTLQTPIPNDEMKPCLTLSKPNHRTLAPSTPALKQLLSAAGLSVSPSPTTLPNFPCSRSSLSSNSVYSFADNCVSLPSPTSSGSTASSLLAKFPAVPFLNDRLMSLSRASGRKPHQNQHHRTMSNANRFGKDRKEAEKEDADVVALCTSMSVPVCVDLAHCSDLMGKTVKLKFD